MIIEDRRHSRGLNRPILTGIVYLKIDKSVVGIDR